MLVCVEDLPVFFLSLNVKHDECVLARSVCVSDEGLWLVSWIGSGEIS